MSKFEEETIVESKFKEPTYNPEPIIKPLVLKVKYHDPELEKIKKIPQGDWIDLRSSENIELDIFEFYKISLGISIKIPKGFEAQIKPRSSTFETWGILQTNGVGCIDESYAGNGDIWKLPVLAMRKTSISKNDRICQFRIIEKQPELKFIEVDNMEDDDRGGFGHSGKN